MGGVFAAIGRFFTDLLAKIVGAAQWLLDVLLQLAKDAWEFCTDLPVWVFDGLLEIVVSAVQGLDISISDTTVAGFGGLPGEVLNVLGLLGVGYALGIVGAAIVVRLGLQLIPFVRLGS